MKPLLASLALGLCASLASAQNCPDIVLGTPFGAVSSNFDWVFASRPLGFAFPLGGATYTDIHITTKGMCYLSNGGVPTPGPADYTATATELVNGPPRVCALWSDIGPGVYGEVYCRNSIGKCTVTWQNAIGFNSPAASFDVQLQLFSTGAIKVFYSPTATNNSTYGAAAAAAIVGVSRGGGATLPAASDFAVVGGTIDNSVYEAWSANAFDLAGKSLQFGPSVPSGWVWSPQVATTCASYYDYGVGCPAAGPDSFHQTFAAGTSDLSNQRIQMTRTSTGYLVTTGLSGVGYFHTPGAGAQGVSPGLLDGQQLFPLSVPMPTPTGTTTTLNVCTKGYVQPLPASAAIDYSPTVAELLASSQTTFACWHDYDQSTSGSGQITFEDVGGVAYVTWNGVYTYGSTTLNTFQFQFQLATGDVTLVFGTFVPSLYSTVVGYSVGGASTDPGPSDLSVAGQLTIRDVQFFGSPLTSTAFNLPWLGNSSFSLRTDNVPNLVGLAFAFVGDQQIAPVDLGFLGSPGCRVYTNGTLGTFSFPVSQPIGVGYLTFPIPNNPALAGAVLTSQSVALSLITPSNLITSNGTEVLIGW